MSQSGLILCRITRRANGLVASMLATGQSIYTGKLALGGMSNLKMRNADKRRRIINERLFKTMAIHIKIKRY